MEDKMKTVETLMPMIFVIFAALLMVIFGYRATERPLTELEAYGFQAVSLFLGLYGSYIFGRRVNKEDIEEFVKPQARSAFRRLVSLYRSISRVAQTVDGDDDDASKVAIVRAIVSEQIGAADDALEDWRDLVPDAVEELRSKHYAGDS